MAEAGKPARRGRMAGFRMSDEHRVKIQNSNILNALIEHVDGRREMTGTQVTAGIALLKKVLPDLQSVTISGDDEKPLKIEHSASLKLAQVLDAIAGRADR